MKKDNNNKDFNSYVKTKTKVRCSVGPLKNNDGELVADQTQMCELLNSFFASVFSVESDGALPQVDIPPVINKLEFVSFGQRLVENKIKN